MEYRLAIKIIMVEVGNGYIWIFTFDSGWYIFIIFLLIKISLEPLQWCSRLNLSPWCQHLMWAPVHVLAAPLPIQLSTYGLRKHWKLAHVLGPLHPYGRSEGGSWILDLNQPSSVAAILGKEPAGRRPLFLSLSFSLSITLPLNLFIYK